MVMLDILIDETRAANARLNESMDSFLAELTAAREWARTVAPPEPPAVSTDEWPLRRGTTDRGSL